MLVASPLAALVLGAYLSKEAQAAPVTPEDQALARAFYLLRQPQHEGFVASSKGPRGTDHKGIPTIGFGTNLRTSGPRLQKLLGADRAAQLQAGSPITKNEAWRTAWDHLKDTRTALTKKVPNLAQYKPDAIGGLLSAGYNTQKLYGPKLTGFLNANEPRRASIELAYGHSADPKKAYGLVKRRVAEANTFRKPYNMKPLPVPPRTGNVSAFYKQHMSAVDGKPKVSQ